MLIKEKQKFSHSFSDTINNIINGAKRYYSKWNEVKKIDIEPQDEDNEMEVDTYWLDISDTSFLGLYRNNIEPEPLKDIQKIIGTEYTYSYIARTAFISIIF